MTVAVVTDSAAALPEELRERYGIVVVPMWMTVGDRSLREGEPGSEALVDAEGVSTSGPTPGEFAAAISSALTDDGVVVLTLAAEMSSTYEAAVVAAEQTPDPDRVRVVDTRTAAGAEALVVLAAAEAARSGASLDEVEDAGRRACGEARLVATVPNLDRLARSGRVPQIARWAGHRLGIAPLFEFRDGRARALRPALSREGALDRIVSQWRRSRVPGARLHVAALHARAREDAEMLLARVRSEAEPATSFVGEFGTVMVVHTGPGLVGLAWRWEQVTGT